MVNVRVGHGHCVVTVWSLYGSVTVRYGHGHCMVTALSRLRCGHCTVRSRSRYDHGSFTVRFGQGSVTIYLEFTAFK
jgi:hypothetical protein